MDLRQQGNWLHSVLEAFFTGRAHNQQICEPLDISNPEAFARDALNRLTALTLTLAPYGRR